MKKIKLLIVSLLISFSFVGCIDEDNDALTGGADLGGLVDSNNPLISYVVGSGNTYTATGSVYQGNVQTTAIDVYKTFTNNVTGSTSNRSLLASIPITDTSIGSIVGWTVSFDYNSLKDGLTVDGASLPTEDGGLNIGDFWTLEYEAQTSEGATHSNSSSTKVAVGTRYAGVYTTVESYYYNGASCSGLCGGNWNGGDRIIESVDATIYRHVGLAYWDDNEFFFTVDNSTGVITVLPEDLEGNGLTLNGSPAMTCASGPGPFEWIPCNDSTSKATPDDVTGEDILEFTVGYHRGTGATREFYTKIVKQVD